MITPSFNLTATERILPRLALDFTTAVLDPRITFTRSGNTATVINSSGVITAINANLPRFDFDPVTLACKGLLTEEARTNLLLNSLIDGTSLATQSVTVTAAAHTLSFYGTGEVVLSGAHSATVTGAGAYPTQTTLTFTPTAGSLTLTVTGTVQFANLELGAFATSFIPTDGTTKTRNADLASMTGTNFSDWFNATEGAFVAETASITTAAATRSIFDVRSATTVRMSLTNFGTSASFAAVNTTTQASIDGTSSVTANVFFKIAAAYKVNNFAAAANGGAVGTDTLGTIPAANIAWIGGVNGTSLRNGWIKTIDYYPQRIINAEVQAFSK
jgi:hypothetical protein